MSEKEALKKKFSSDPDKYYRVELFERKGFERRRCSNCGSFFWTLDHSRRTCAQQPCQLFDFLGNPPASKKLDYVQTWRVIEDFFEANGHESIRRYPVVCRWRPDLYFTVASIIDFQRVEEGRVVFELPANPLIVPQMCLRFNDVSNVGVTGKHYTCLCMVGQHSIQDEGGYYKDRCIELDFQLLTNVFSIRPEEVVFVEDAWLGYGAFGYSLEYYVRGLELGNAVFTEFEGTPRSFTAMKKKVVDMGAGLERFSWITQGTPSSYEAVFGSVVKTLRERCDVEYDAASLSRYYRLAGALDVEHTSDFAAAKEAIAKQLGFNSADLAEKIEPLEAIYVVADHVRGLVFAISDGGLPSNVGGGYNLRVVLRRAASLIEKYKWKITLWDVAGLHIDQLATLFPELEEHRSEVETILKVEWERLKSANARTDRTVSSLARTSKKLTDDDLIRLYESEGIAPELLKAKDIIPSVPQDFYSKVASMHLSEKPIEEEEAFFDTASLPETRLLYYDDVNLLRFEAKVVKVFPKHVVLDRTAFYPRGGGQEPDYGVIGGVRVVDVVKSRGVVLHMLDNSVEFKEGKVVECLIDEERRLILRRHHTATHVLNGAARRVLGSWVWQHSAFKDVDVARLDITHFAHLGREEVQRIEKLANGVVLRNIPVVKEVLDRGDAESKYSFRIYQGGVVPGGAVRIINIPEWDVEACGGLHCDRTGDIGLIKVLKSERIQDGVERLEFVAGNAALELFQKQEEVLDDAAESLEAQRWKIVEAVGNVKSQFEALKKNRKAILRRLASLESRDIPSEAEDVAGVKLCVKSEPELDEDYHITLGEGAVKNEPKLLYCGLVSDTGVVKVLVFAGEAARSRGIHAGDIARAAAKMLGGSGGGDARFGQGGGPGVDGLKKVAEALPDLVKEILRKSAS